MNLAPVRVRRMQADGQNTAEVRKRVSLDHFVASPNFRLQAARIIESMESAMAGAKAAAEALNKAILEKEAGARDLAAYSDALFTGIVTVKGSTVSYVRSGMVKKDEILCQYGEAYPYASIPVYQGFVSFQALPPEEKQSIAKSAANRINQGSDEIKKALESLRESVLNDGKLAGYQSMAADMRDQAEILDFLERLLQRFTAFDQIHS